MRTVTGTLKAPNTAILSGGLLTFIASQTHGQVLEGTSSTAVVNASGVYSITMNDGRYHVYYSSSDQAPIYLGRITVQDGLEVVSLDTLLVETSPLIPFDIREYIQEQVSLAITNASAGYIHTDYADNDTPSNPSVLVGTVTRVGDGLYSLTVDWNPSINTSGLPIEYQITYWHDSARKFPATALTNSLTIYPIEVNQTYYFEIRARSGTTYAGSLLEGTISTNILPVYSLDTETVTINGGLGYIAVNWTNPSQEIKPLIHVYASTLVNFSPASDNLVQSTYSQAFIHFVYDPDVDWYYKFQVENSVGEVSAITPTVSPLGPYNSIRIDDTTIGRIIAEGALTAQQMADGSIDQDKFAAHAITASKLAVLDLNNLVNNHMFIDDKRLFDTDGVTVLGYEHWTCEPGGANYATSEEITLVLNSVVDNDYIVTGVEAGDKFYCAARLSWLSAAGSADKGLQIVFLNSSGVEIVTDNFTATNTDSTPDTDVLVDGFATAPAHAIEAYIRLRVGATTANITYKNIILRHGSAVLIEPDGITAEKVNTLSLFAAQIKVNSGGTLRVGDNPGDNFNAATDPNYDPANTDFSGIILGSAFGLIGYNTAGEETFSISPTGAAWFGGDLTGASLGSDGELTVGGDIIMNASTGKIHTAGKTTPTNTTKGIFLGYSGTSQQFAVGDGTKYLLYDGTKLEIKGNIVGSNITGTNISGSSLQINATGKIYSAGKTTYASTTAGFFLGKDGTPYKLNIGSSTKYLKWDGTDLKISRTNYKAGGTWTGSKLIMTYKRWVTYPVDEYTPEYVNDLLVYAPTVEVDTGYNIAYAVDSSTGAGLVVTAIPTAVSGDAALSTVTAVANISAPLPGATGRVKIKVSFFVDVAATGWVSSGNVSYKAVSITGFKWFLRELF